jgi:hypothetical protein
MAGFSQFAHKIKLMDKILYCTVMEQLIIFSSG